MRLERLDGSLGELLRPLQIEVQHAAEALPLCPVIAAICASVHPASVPSALAPTLACCDLNAVFAPLRAGGEPWNVRAAHHSGSASQRSARPKTVAGFAAAAAPSRSAIALVVPSAGRTGRGLVIRVLADWFCVRSGLVHLGAEGPHALAPDVMAGRVSAIHVLAGSLPLSSCPSPDLIRGSDPSIHEAVQLAPSMRRGLMDCRVGATPSRWRDGDPRPGNDEGEDTTARAQPSCPRNAMPLTIGQPWDMSGHDEQD